MQKIILTEADRISQEVRKIGRRIGMITQTIARSKSSPESKHQLNAATMFRLRDERAQLKVEMAALKKLAYALMAASK